MIILESSLLDNSNDAQDSAILWNNSNKHK